MAYFDRPHALVTLQFTIANVGAGATPVDGALINGKTGYVVPTGYKFVPEYIDAHINDARTAGTSTIKVTSSGTELVGGPEALIDGTNTTDDTGFASQEAVVAAGATVGVSATGSGTFAPTTADADVIVQGYLIPA